MNQDQLLNLCRKNDQRAMYALYDLYKALVFGICRRYLKNYPDAEDVCQEAFLKIFESLKDLRSADAIVPWMKRIAVNTAINFYHKRKRQSLLLDCDEIEQHTDVEEANVMLAFDQDDILLYISELTDGQRIIFNLYEIEGFSHKEIASLLGVTTGTSKTQLSRARESLKKKISHSSNLLNKIKYA